MHRESHGFSRLYALGLALTAFGAVYQPSFLGYLAASPGVLLIGLSLCLLPLVPGHRSLSHRQATWLIGYGVVISVPSIPLFGLTPAFLGKTGTLLILTSIWISPLLCVPHMRMAHVRKGLIAAIVISATGFLLADLLRGSLPTSLTGIIFGGEYADYDSLRPRAFMQENSHFAAMVSRYLFALFLIRESGRSYSPRRLLWFMALMVAILAGLGSKGAAISVLAAALTVGLTRKLLPAFVLMLPLISWLVLEQVNSVAIDLENFTSVSTRATLLLTTLSGIICDPLGYGYYGFYGAVQTFGGWSMNWLGDQVPLVLSEVSQIVEELNNVSTKSTLMDFLLIFGLPFIAMMRSIIKRCQTADPRVKAALMYALLSALSTSGHESISFFLVLAVLVRWYPRPHQSQPTRRRTRHVPSPDGSQFVPTPA
jgi:hypothetical protein